MPQYKIKVKDKVTTTLKPTHRHPVNCQHSKISKISTEKAMEKWFQEHKDCPENYATVEKQLRVYALSHLLFKATMVDNKWRRFGVELQFFKNERYEFLVSMTHAQHHELDILIMACDRVIKHMWEKPAFLSLMNTVEKCNDNQVSTMLRVEEIAEENLLIKHWKNFLPGMGTRVIFALLWVCIHFYEIVTGRLSKPTLESFNGSDTDMVSVARREGREAFCKGKYSEAIKQYTKAIGTSPYHYIMYSNRAQAYINTRKYEAARLDALRTTILAPTWSKGHYRLVESLRLLQCYRAAVKANAVGLRYCPNDKDLVKQQHIINLFALDYDSNDEAIYSCGESDSIPDLETSDEDRDWEAYQNGDHESPTVCDKHIYVRVSDIRKAIGRRTDTQELCAAAEDVAPRGVVAAQIIGKVWTLYIKDRKTRRRLLKKGLKIQGQNIPLYAYKLDDDYHPPDPDKLHKIKLTQHFSKVPEKERAYVKCRDLERILGPSLTMSAELHDALLETVEDQLTTICYTKGVYEIQFTSKIRKDMLVGNGLYIREHRIPLYVADELSNSECLTEAELSVFDSTEDEDEDIENSQVRVDPVYINVDEVSAHLTKSRLHNAIEELVGKHKIVGSFDDPESSWLHFTLSDIEARNKVLHPGSLKIDGEELPVHSSCKQKPDTEELAMQTTQKICEEVEPVFLYICDIRETVKRTVSLEEIKHALKPLVYGTDMQVLPGPDLYVLQPSNNKMRDDALKYTIKIDGHNIPITAKLRPGYVYREGTGFVKLKNFQHSASCRAKREHLKSDCTSNKLDITANHEHLHRHSHRDRPPDNEYYGEPLVILDSDTLNIIGRKINHSDVVTEDMIKKGSNNNCAIERKADCFLLKIRDIQYKQQLIRHGITIDGKKVPVYKDSRAASKKSAASNKQPAASSSPKKPQAATQAPAVKPQPESGLQQLERDFGKPLTVKLQECSLMLRHKLGHGDVRRSLNTYANQNDYELFLTTEHMYIFAKSDDAKELIRTRGITVDGHEMLMYDEHLNKPLTHVKHETKHHEHKAKPANSSTPTTISDTTSPSPANVTDNSSASSQPEQPVDDFTHHLEQGCGAYVRGLMMNAIDHLEKANNLHSNNTQKKLIKQAVLVKYLLGNAHLDNGETKGITTAMAYYKEILESSSVENAVLGHLGLGKSLYQLNNHSEALKHLNEGLRGAGRFRNQLSNIKLPGTTEVLPETLNGKLKETFECLLYECRYPPPPVAVCRYVLCHKHHKNVQIFKTDPDFQGYVLLCCYWSCCIKFHVDCWKRQKTVIMGKSPDKEILGKECFTDGCQGRIVEIVIYNSMCEIKTSHKPSAVTQEEKPKRPVLKQKPSSLKRIAHIKDYKSTRKRKREERKKENNPTEETEQNEMSEEVVITETPRPVVQPTESPKAADVNHKLRDVKPLPKQPKDKDEKYMVPSEQSSKAKGKKNRDRGAAKNVMSLDQFLGHPVPTICGEDAVGDPLAQEFPGLPIVNHQPVMYNQPNILQRFTPTINPATPMSALLSTPKISHETSSDDSEVNAEGLLMVFEDILDRHGPLHVMDIKIQNEIRDFPDVAKQYIINFGGVNKFLLQRFAFLDNFVCLLRDVGKARTVSERYKQNPQDFVLAEKSMLDEATPAVENTLNPEQYPTLSAAQVVKTSTSTVKPELKLSKVAKTKKCNSTKHSTPTTPLTGDADDFPALGGSSSSVGYGGSFGDRSSTDREVSMFNESAINSGLPCYNLDTSSMSSGGVDSPSVMSESSVSVKSRSDRSNSITLDPLVQPFTPSAAYYEQLAAKTGTNTVTTTVTEQNDTASWTGYQYANHYGIDVSSNSDMSGYTNNVDVLSSSVISDSINNSGVVGVIGEIGDQRKKGNKSDESSFELHDDYKTVENLFDSHIGFKSLLSDTAQSISKDYLSWSDDANQGNSKSENTLFPTWSIAALGESNSDADDTSKDGSSSALLGTKSMRSSTSESVKDSNLPYAQTYNAGLELKARKPGENETLRSAGITGPSNLALSASSYGFLSAGTADVDERLVRQQALIVEKQARELQALRQEIAVLTGAETAKPMTPNATQDTQVQQLLEEARVLRHKNEALQKEIETLHDGKLNAEQKLKDEKANMEKFKIMENDYNRMQNENTQLIQTHGQLRNKESELKGSLEKATSKDKAQQLSWLESETTMKQLLVDNFIRETRIIRVRYLHTLQFLRRHKKNEPLYVQALTAWTTKLMMCTNMRRELQLSHQLCVEQIQNNAALTSVISISDVLHHAPNSATLVDKPEILLNIVRGITVYADQFLTPDKTVSVQRLSLLASCQVKRVWSFVCLNSDVEDRRHIPSYNYTYRGPIRHGAMAMQDAQMARASTPPPSVLTQTLQEQSHTPPTHMPPQQQQQQHSVIPTLQQHAAHTLAQHNATYTALQHSSSHSNTPLHTATSQSNAPHNTLTQSQATTTQTQNYFSQAATLQNNTMINQSPQPQQQPKILQEMMQEAAAAQAQNQRTTLLPLHNDMPVQGHVTSLPIPARTLSPLLPTQLLTSEDQATVTTSTPPPQPSLPGFWAASMSHNLMPAAGMANSTTQVGVGCGTGGGRPTVSPEPRKNNLDKIFDNLLETFPHTPRSHFKEYLAEFRRLQSSGTLSGLSLKEIVEGITHLINQGTKPAQHSFNTVDLDDPSIEPF